jgi:hypothetical protein
MSILAFYLRFLPKSPYHCYLYGSIAIMAALALSVSIVSIRRRAIPIHVSAA